MACANVLELIKNTYLRNKLSFFVVISVASGIILATILRATAKTPYTSREVMYVGIFGEIFLQLLKGVALPLMASCLIVAFGTVDANMSGRIGKHMALFYILTKVEAVCLSILLSVVIHPGASSKSGSGPNTTTEELSTKIILADTFLDLLRNLFPSSWIEMTLKTYETVLIRPENATLDSMNEWDVKDGGNMKDVVNLLGVVNVAILFGIASRSIGPGGEAVLDLVKCVCEVTFQLTTWVMWCAPVLLISLLAGQVLKVEALESVLSHVGLYLLCIFLVHFFQFVIVYPLLYFLFTRKNPFRFLYYVLDAVMMSAATASSLAAMPIAIQCLEDKAQCTPMLVRFVMPVGLNVNKDGAAIIVSIGSIFIAQMNDMTLDVSHYLGIAVLGLASSVAAAGVPVASIVLIVLVMEALGIPTQDIGLLLAVDFIVDRISTPVNVWANCTIAAIVDFIHTDSLLEIREPVEDVETNEAEDEEVN